MKIPKNLLAAMALTLGAAVVLSSCDPNNDDLTIKTEQKGGKNVNNGENSGENQEPAPCPACGMG